MNWMLLPLKRYADFNGRSRRMEFWMFYLFQVIVYSVLALLLVVFAGVGGSEDGSVSGLSGAFLVLFFLAMLALFIPTLAVTVRRLHDQDKSGWWYLLNFVPFGGIVVLVFMCLDGTPGPNQYGPDPKEGAGNTFD